MTPGTMRWGRSEIDRRTALLVLLVLSSARAAAAEPQWQWITGMPAPRSYHASGTIQDTWFIAGGITVDNTGEHYLPDVYAYDPKIKTWKLAGQLATGREFLTAVA